MRTEPIAEKNIAPAIVCTTSWRLTKVKPLQDYNLEVEFIDGAHGFVEMKQLIMSSKAGVFAKLMDVNTFNRAYLEYGVVTWPGEIDLAPDAMYNEIKRNGTWVLK
ncbi:MAG: hypothetical protein ACD_21C00052G0007 [uncultured bacterium]|nr:MAG: hypothetical protein ACD_21C00052G0007 [uncultured bacterium]